MEGEGGSPGAGPPAAGRGLGALRPGWRRGEARPAVSGVLVGGALDSLAFWFLGGFRGCRASAGAFRGRLVVVAPALLGLGAGAGGGCLLPRRAECSHGLAALWAGAGAGVSRWPTGPRAPARAPPLQPVPRVGAELLRHRVSTGYTHCLHPWEAGAQAAGGHGQAASVRHPGEGEVPPNPSRSPPFQPRRLLLTAPGARPSSDRRRKERTAWGRQRRRKVKAEQTKNHPQPRGAQLQQRRRFSGQGETRAKGQNGDRPLHRALLQPGRPALPPGGGSPGTRAEPRRGGQGGAESRRGG